jgi:Na+:H+ antiporter, NhaA family
MSQQLRRKRIPVLGFLFENSLFLILGALAALIWANVDNGSYLAFVHFDLSDLLPDGTQGGEEALHATGKTSSTEHAGFTLHALVNDLLMALFFALAAKEVWVSLLPGGALSNVRKAATPLLATLGGVLGPAVIYAAGAAIIGESGWLGQPGELGRGWAIPCATDIAFSFLVARIIFGPGHPAIAFLLLLAIADDAAGLVILAVFYPSGELQLRWFLLTATALLMAVGMRRVGLDRFWWYLLIPGSLSWLSFYLAGIHPALGLVPLIPCLPHARTAIVEVDAGDRRRGDTLTEFEHWWKRPVELILGLFGLFNAGVVLGSVGPATYLVLLGLLVGKPVGITLLTWLAVKSLRLELPEGMSFRHIVSLGMVAGIGFTVALFVASAAFRQPGPLQDAAKMGALLSFVAAPLAILLARVVGVRPQRLASRQPLA